MRLGPGPRTLLLAFCTLLGSTVTRADSAREYQQPFVWTGSTFGLQGIYGQGSATWYQGLLDGTPEGKDPGPLCAK